MATIKDVAQMAGVSIATVSNYLNQTKPVSKTAAASIQAAVEALHYSQNLSAKNLKSHAYTDVGVILPNFNDSYYVQIFHGIETAFQNSDYFINVAFTYDIPEVEENIARNFLKKQVCGLILVSCRPDQWKFYYDNFTAKGRPIVMLDRMIRSLEANFIAFDNQADIYHMTKRLLELDYENLYLFAGPAGFECEDSCRRGFIGAHNELRRTVGENAIIQTELNKEDAFRNTIRLLKREVPDAIVATCESTATGITEGLRLLGYSAQDIPVLTLGEDHWNQHTQSLASFSTARLAIKMGDTASRLLVQQLRSPMRETEKILLQDTVQDTRAALLEALPRRKPKKTQDPAKSTLEILMLDSPVVHTFRGLLKNFEDQSGMRVNVTILPHHNLLDEIMRTWDDPDGIQYDVLMFDIPWLSSFASQGILADISEPLQSIDKNTFFDGCLQHFSEFHGQYYGVPFMYGPQIFYYRKDLFDDPLIRASFEKEYGSSLRPPSTLKEFNAIAEFFSLKSDVIDYGISIAAAYDECLAPELYMRLQAYGSDLFDQDGRVIFDNPQTLKAYINFKRVLRCAKPDYLQANDVSIVQDFLRGDTAMLITYPAFLTDVFDLRKSSLVGSIGYSLIPGRAPLLGGWSLGVNSRSAQQEQAFAFIKWTCSKQMSNYFALLGGQTAVTRTYTNDELVKLYPWLPLYYKAYEYTRPTVTPETPTGHIVPASKVDRIVCKWAYRLIADEVEIQAAITSTHKELEELIDSYSRIDE